MADRGVAEDAAYWADWYAKRKADWADWYANQDPERKAEEQVLVKTMEKGVAKTGGPVSGGCQAWGTDGKEQESKKKPTTGKKGSTEGTKEEKEEEQALAGFMAWLKTSLRSGRTSAAEVAEIRTNKRGLSAVETTSSKPSSRKWQWAIRRRRAWAKDNEAVWTR